MPPFPNQSNRNNTAVTVISSDPDLSKISNSLKILTFISLFLTLVVTDEYLLQYACSMFHCGKCKIGL